jgi:hypothetical protein
VVFFCPQLLRVSRRILDRAGSSKETDSAIIHALQSPYPKTRSAIPLPLIRAFAKSGNLKSVRITVHWHALTAGPRRPDLLGELVMTPNLLML